MKELLLAAFPFEPTPNQEEAIDALSAFVGTSFNKQLFVLKGYAGTGKTTLISSLIEVLNNCEKNCVLMAPTGRAAKVLSSYSGEVALTIHKSIYYQKSEDGRLVFSLQQNKLKDAIFIVDEASMIGNSGALGGSFNSLERTLLDDLIQFVYTGNNCKLILIGDTAQLPPVGCLHSPALDISYMQARYPITIFTTELTEVTRQSLNSGILYNATVIRNMIEDELVFPVFDIDGFKDVERLQGELIEETLASAYSIDGVEESIVVCRSNKQANSFNKYIRYNVLYLEDELAAGDLLMVVKNNYYWLDVINKSGFIANGDVLELLRVTSFEEKFGKRFANVTAVFSGEQEGSLNELEVKVLMDTLYTETPSLGKNEAKDFYLQVQESYAHIKDRKEKRDLIKKDEYFNALQVKFSYAITCHKSQGGQWKNVFVDQGYLLEEMIDKDYFRWLYTAVTRAQSNLYLLNFHNKFFSEQIE